MIKLFAPKNFPFLGHHLTYERCPDGFTTSIVGATNVGDCLLPICQKGSYLNSTFDKLELRYKLGLV